MCVNEITSSRRWFHANINGVDAENLLEQGKYGSFLVRPSTKQPGDYALSVRRGKGVTHIRIQNTGECYDLYGGEQFATLTELVQHYTENWGELKEKGGKTIQLQHPLLSADPTTEQWFHTQISGKTAETLLMEKGRNGSYLVRGSLSNLGDFVLSVRMEERVMHIMIKCNEGKYSMEGGDSFDTLTDLVEYNKEYPTMDTNGAVIKLEVAFTRETHISALRFSDKVKELMEKEQQDRTKGFTEEFEALAGQEPKEFLEKNEGKTAANKPKNRYRNILPFDHTRIVLKNGDPNTPGSDYINANLITNRELPESKRQYIATQGCLQTTVTDFWRMIWQQNSRVIVMTASLIERGKSKCVKYWPEPDETNDMMMYTGLLTVINVSETTTEHYIMREFEVSFKSSRLCQPGLSAVVCGKVSNLHSLMLSSQFFGSPVLLLYKDDHCGMVFEMDTSITPELARKIYHFHFTGWPDHGVPSDPDCVLSFLQDIGNKQETIPDAGPIVVHCSAGIGRTGTVLIIDMILQQIKQQGLECEIDVHKMTLMVRAQRSGMVQTEAQYRFIYMAVRHYIDTTLQRMQAEQGGHANHSAQMYENIGPLKTDPNQQH